MTDQLVQRAAGSMAMQLPTGAATALLGAPLLLWLLTRTAGQSSPLAAAAPGRPGRAGAQTPMPAASRPDRTSAAGCAAPNPSSPHLHGRSRRWGSAGNLAAPGSAAASAPPSKPQQREGRCSALSVLGNRSPPCEARESHGFAWPQPGLLVSCSGGRQPPRVQGEWPWSEAVEKRATSLRHG